MKVVAILLIVGTAGLGPLSGLASRVRTASAQAEAAGNKESIWTSFSDGRSQSPMAPEEVARSFYRWYLKELYQAPNGDTFRGHKAVVEQYVTARLLQKLANSKRTNTVRKGPDVETDYFFGTLDLSSEWEKNITVPSPTMMGATAVVHISFSGTAENRGRLGVELERKVALKQEGGLWKIDEVGVWGQ